ncbi:MAG: peptide chain release factor N(5)-glutamine methyltransferase [Candidatus Margulisiibacteriota bacterium]
MTLTLFEKEILMSHALKIDRAHLVSHPELFDEENPVYRSLVKRRLKHEPLAYITGYQPFLGLNFFVDHSVLIPRPETEELVELAAHYALRIAHYLILDIGTGSGAIAVSLAKSLLNAIVIGTDSSPEAIKVAEHNAKLHKVEKQCKFIVGNLFGAVDQKADIIISNPPYIPTGDLKDLMPDVRDWEPHSALDGGPDGLKYIIEIIRNAPKHLNRPGHLLIEFGMGQAKEIESEAKKYFDLVEIKKELSGIDRFLHAKI